MKNGLIKISIGILALCLFAACGSLKSQFFKEKRPFREREFNAEKWRSGDAQTRGEMSKDLRWKKDEKNNYFFDRKSRRQVLEILGEPDRKTRGLCCGGGRGAGTSEEEVWLYNLEVETGSTMNIEHFQIYFHESGVVDAWRVAEWDDDNPNYIPRVG